MGFKPVTSLDADTAISLGKIDEKGKTTNSIEGYYLGFRTTTNSYGDSNLHVFQTPKGNVGVWGSANMDQKLKQVKPGTMTRVTANGLAPKKPGKNPMKLFLVSVDEDNVTEVSEAEEGGEDTNYDAAGNTGFYDDVTAEDFPEPVPDFVASRTGKTPAERQAEVQAMLKSRKKTS